VRTVLVRYDVSLLIADGSTRFELRRQARHGARAFRQTMAPLEAGRRPPSNNRAVTHPKMNPLTRGIRHATAQLSVRDRAEIDAVRNHTPTRRPPGYVAQWAVPAASACVARGYVTEHLAAAIAPPRRDWERWTPEGGDPRRLRRVRRQRRQDGGPSVLISPNAYRRPCCRGCGDASCEHGRQDRPEVRPMRVGGDQRPSGDERTLPISSSTNALTAMIDAVITGRVKVAAMQRDRNHTHVASLWQRIDSP
jgi:hypothetical protein